MIENISPLKLEEIPAVDFQAGVMLLVDKPNGHSGTLDPMATGLLIICVGKYTKKLQHFEGLGKSYTGTIKFGETTPSYDAESEVDGTFPIENLKKEAILAEAEKTLGWIDQYPPMFSAIKINGQPLYKLARKGITIERKPRKVEIQKFDLTKFELPFVDFESEVSKGTYIRSLAHDLGQSVNNGAHLTALRRTKIGDFSIENAFNLEELVAEIQKRDFPEVE